MACGHNCGRDARAPRAKAGIQFSGGLELKFELHRHQVNVVDPKEQSVFDSWRFTLVIDLRRHMGCGS
ncbi:MAG: hypothetical protein L0387_24850 [Acidobacteria bacterium]|nr:hypothetical protein [Acidobacteriota bacterium]